MTLSRLHICTTCQRDKPLAANELSRGRTLANTVQDLLTEQSLGPEFVIRKVHCLNGCLNPCNASFRAQGKYSLRFSRLNADDAEQLLVFAKAYRDAIDGDVPESEWPESLRDKLSARTPPPQVLAATRQS